MHNVSTNESTYFNYYRYYYVSLDDNLHNNISATMIFSNNAIISIDCRVRFKF